MKTNNEKYCSNCEQVINIQDNQCPFCGAEQPKSFYSNQQSIVDSNKSNKDWLTTLLLCIFLGYLGIHRFYTGNTVIGIAQLCTGGGCGIWWIIDAIMLVTGNYKDGEGKIVKNS